MSDAATDKPKLSAVEGFKTASNYLRGPIAEELVDGNADFTGEAMQLLKHHGTYMQDDRDRRKEAKAAGVPKGKYFSMMIRSVIPGGRLNSEQMLRQLNLCDKIGNGTIRLTDTPRNPASWRSQGKSQGIHRGCQRSTADDTCRVW